MPCVAARSLSSSVETAPVLIMYCRHPVTTLRNQTRVSVCPQQCRHGAAGRPHVSNSKVHVKCAVVQAKAAAVAQPTYPHSTHGKDCMHLHRIISSVSQHEWALSGSVVRQQRRHAQTCRASGSSRQSDRSNKKEKLDVPPDGDDMVRVLHAQGTIADAAVLNYA